MKAIFSLFLIALVIMTCNKTKTVQASPVDSGSAATASNPDRVAAHILPVIPEGGSLQQTPQILPVPPVAP
ncbi:hypothetical protein Ocin01_07898 [Orchesella cincta]|uniref:Uncharacterized protein n=1 Tax=Orchesella cincta TaxID=48709 RepID=A0A1D2N0G2_ORCCI|nr:hypothetical protein Ocin01_07898 [Orchesella cincta]